MEQWEILYCCSLFGLGSLGGAARYTYDVFDSNRRFRWFVMFAHAAVGGLLAVAVVLLFFSSLGDGDNPRHWSIGMGVSIFVGLLGGDTYEKVLVKVGNSLMAAIKALSNGSNGDEQH